MRAQRRARGRRKLHRPFQKIQGRQRVNGSFPRPTDFTVWSFVSKSQKSKSKHLKMRMMCPF